MEEPLSARAPVDRLVLLETFVRIVEAGSLSAAAAQLGATQPTVSRRLQALERLLGVRLLQRSTHGMTLTPDGARCHDQAAVLIANWHALRAEVRGDDEEPSGLLRVVAPHAFGQQQFIAPVVAYLRRYPGMQVEWLLQDRTPDFAAEGIDCAIRIGPVQSEAVVAVSLGEVPRVAVAAPSLLAGRPVPRDPAELATLPWLALRTFYRDEVVLTHVSTGEVARFAIRPRFSTDGLMALRTAAIEGLGVGIASAWALPEEIEAGRLVHVAPQWQAAPLPVALVYPPARYQAARLRRFIEAMRAALPDALRRAVAPGQGAA